MIWSGSKTDNKVAITFDDGPKPDQMKTILDILRKYKVKATFFVIGRHSETYPDLIYRIDQEGHDLGNHTYSHHRLDTLTDSQVELEISAATDILKSITGKTITIFRPPGGKFNLTVRNALDKMNMKMILWDVNAGDYTHDSPFYGIKGERSAQNISERVLSGAEHGSIILMHSGGDETIKSLPVIITGLRKRGFKLVTLSELLNGD
ncbi:polysaccharide deacetylase family protein [Thermoproteota archaeon]